MASVVEWFVRSTAVREDVVSNPAGATVGLSVFPPKATYALSHEYFVEVCVQ